MNIIFVGDLNERTRSYQRLRALRDQGHEIIGLGSEPIGFQPGISDNFVGIGGKFLGRMFDKIGRPLDFMRLNRRLVDLCRAHTPDLVWMEKNLIIKAGTLRQLKTDIPELKIAFYSEDDMFAVHNQSQFFLEALPYYDAVFTTKSYNCNQSELPALGAKRIIFVDKAFDRYDHSPTTLTQAERAFWSAEVGFIGSFEIDRARSMLFLAEQGVDVRVWGNGWHEWVDMHKRLRVENRPIFGGDYARALCATKVNLCFLRKINRDLQTDRSVEIPGCGAFMLAERSAEHERLFVDKKEAVFFEPNDLNDLLAKTKHFLENDTERQQIALLGRERCIKSGYDHHSRLEYMLRELN